MTTTENPLDTSAVPLPEPDAYLNGGDLSEVKDSDEGMWMIGMNKPDDNFGTPIYTTGKVEAYGDAREAATRGAVPANWNEDSSLETWFPYTAERLKALEAENEKLRAAGRAVAVPARYFADGPEGYFFADDLKLARNILNAYDHDEDWTITDLHEPAPTPQQPEAEGAGREAVASIKEVMGDGGGKVLDWPKGMLRFLREHPVGTKLYTGPTPAADARYYDLPINDAVPAPTQILPGNLFLWNWRAMQEYGRACIAHAASASVPEAERAKGEAVAWYSPSLDSVITETEMAGRRRDGSADGTTYTVRLGALDPAPPPAGQPEGLEMTGKVNGYLPRQRAIEIKLDGEVPQWMTAIPPPAVKISQLTKAGMLRDFVEEIGPTGKPTGYFDFSAKALVEDMAKKCGAQMQHINDGQPGVQWAFTAIGLHEFARRLASAPQAVRTDSDGVLPALQVGSLPTLNQDEYPALGDWWVQLWAGDEVFARVYGPSPDDAHQRATEAARRLASAQQSVGSEQRGDSARYEVLNGSEVGDA